LIRNAFVDMIMIEARDWRRRTKNIKLPNWRAILDAIINESQRIVAVHMIYVEDLWQFFSAEVVKYMACAASLTCLRSRMKVRLRQ
jgi:hypothetical protein